jgi:hypothetical protein
MKEHLAMKYRPGLEPLEAKQLLSVAASTIPLAHPMAGTRSLAVPPATAAATPGATHPGRVLSGRASSIAQHGPTVSVDAVRPLVGYLVYRVTNPNRFNNKLIPPFGHVLTQHLQPVPGQTYNVLYIAVRNGTGQTFDASSNFQVAFPQEHGSFPILTGNETWKSGQWFIFYVLTKWYYPLPSQVHSGWIFDLGGARSVGIPGPSGIFQRVKYDPTRFTQMLDQIVTHGVGAQGGKGIRFGMPDTAIDEFVAASTRRNDFGGYF